MNRKLTLIAALALLPIAACSSQKPQPVTTEAAAPATPPVAANDQTFANMAASGGLAEIQAAQLALTKTKSPGVTKFANTMIADHTAADQKLMTLAQSKGITLPTAPTDEETQQIAKLQGETGRKFVHDYLAGQMMDHQTMLTTFQDEAANGTDPDLKAFAAATAPTVQQHLMMAKALTGGRMHPHMMHKHTTAAS